MGPISSGFLLLSEKDTRNLPPANSFMGALRSIPCSISMLDKDSLSLLSTSGMKVAFPVVAAEKEKVERRQGR